MLTYDWDWLIPVFLSQAEVYDEELVAVPTDTHPRYEKKINKADMMIKVKINL